MFPYSNQTNAYSGNYGGKNPTQGGQSDFDTLQKARKDLIGEIEAIIQYDEHLHKTNNELAKATWENIRDEELVHVGELLGLLNDLAPYQKQLVEEGWKEFRERIPKRQ